jgi:hypothetical protein
MKTIINYRNMVLALVTFLTLAVSPAANATDDKNATSVELKFIGNYKNKPVFELQFAQAGTDNEYVVVIRDEYGNSIYRETFSSNILSKKFLLNTDEIGDDTLRFEITGKTSNKTVVYAVNQNSRFVEEVSVTKVN